MSLTGPIFLTLVVLVTLSAFAGLVILWPRLSGPQIPMIAARTGLLLTVNLLVLLTAATQLNAQYLFFADWTDLGGAVSHQSTATSLHRGGSAAAATSTVVARGQQRIVATSTNHAPIRTTPGDTTYVIHGAASGITSSVVVNLPADYAAQVRAGHRLPVLETFPGYPGVPQQWLHTMQLPEQLAAGSAAHRVQDAVVVAPQTEIPAGVDTECVNGPLGQPQVETWLARDVPAWVTANFFVSPERSAWATVGLSAGGWCSAMVTLLHPEQFSAAIILGGYFHPDFGPWYEPFPPGSPLARRYDLVDLVRRQPPPVALWIETSHSDPVSFSSSSALLKAGREPLAVNAVVLQHAGHRLTVWKPLLPAALSWLGTNVPGFRP